MRRCIAPDEYLQMLQTPDAAQTGLDVSAGRPSLLETSPAEQTAPALAFGGLVQVRVLMVAPDPEAHTEHLDIANGV